MLCQNCKRNDATTHLKRIINGEAAEIHLCSSCALSLGVGSAMGGLSSFPSFSSISNMFSSNDTKRISNKVLRCETCGFSFEDILKTGMPGCPDCYKAFSQKFKPIIGKLHGRAVYMGKTKEKVNKTTQKHSVFEIEELKEQMAQAIENQNFELAAVLRDKINEYINAEAQQ